MCRYTEKYNCLIFYNHKPYFFHVGWFLQSSYFECRYRLHGHSREHTLPPKTKNKRRRVAYIMHVSTLNIYKLLYLQNINEINEYGNIAKVMFEI